MHELVTINTYHNNISTVQNKCSTIPPSTSVHFSTLLTTVHLALLGSSWLSLLQEGSTVHSASDQFVSCVHFFYVDFAFHPSPETKIGSVRYNFKQLYVHTNWKLDTCLFELIYSEYSILPPPKILTIPPETPCIYVSNWCAFPEDDYKGVETCWGWSFIALVVHM